MNLQLYCNYATMAADRDDGIGLYIEDVNLNELLSELTNKVTFEQIKKAYGLDDE